MSNHSRERFVNISLSSDAVVPLSARQCHVRLSNDGTHFFNIYVGQLQVSDKERSRDYETMFRDVVNIIVEKSINPQTKRPYTYGK